ncbi:MAG: PrsW family glutamic-type intramembrane protease [Methanomassiliicoccales archaeon]|nr:PrsW family glutamic-type intramembrane protease [Methanomassiliicoccales archaeon]
MALTQILQLIILIFAAVVPSLIFLSWFRSASTGKRESWLQLLILFLYGAIIAVVIAILIELLAITLLLSPVFREYEILSRNPSLLSLIIVVVIAPFAEEFAKMLGLLKSSTKLRQTKSGFVFGAATGLGFAATENLLYESVAMAEGGVLMFLTVALLRSYSSALLHGSATSIVGYGVAKKRFEGKSITPYYLFAVMMHGAFNLLVSLGGLFDDNRSIIVSGFGLFLSFVLVLLAIKFINSKLNKKI